MAREEQINNAKHSFYERVFEEGSYHDSGDCFEEGAEWADEYTKNPWISVKDDLPCNHAEMLHPMCNVRTQYVITSIEGLCYINQMIKYRDKWIWEMDKPTHWMPIPKLPEE